MTDLSGDSALPFHVRQGDVLIVAIDALPPDAIEIPHAAGRVVIAYGEGTGHAHAIHGVATALLQRPGDQDRYLHVDVTSNLEHEEHGSISLPAGAYRVIYQRVFEPTAETMSRGRFD